MADWLVIPHDLYRRLGASSESYRALFQDTPDEQALASLRKATNNAWVLGKECFRQGIEELLQHQAGLVNATYAEAAKAEFVYAPGSFGAAAGSSTQKERF